VQRTHDFERHDECVFGLRTAKLVCELGDALFDLAKPSIVDPSKAPKPLAEKPEVKRNTPPSRGSRYSVQVAAYTHKAEADRLASSLNKRGYSARVDGSVAPFRVRIGRYTTERDAEDALKKLKSKHMDGFVVRAPER
jgi:cell division protein FtsN